MRKVNETNIKQFILAGENETVEFKRTVSPILKNEVIAFANVQGGIVIIGYDEQKNIVDGVNPLVYGKACNVLKEYLDLCDIYFVEYEQKQLLIIEVLKADGTLSFDEKIYYRDGESVKSLDLDDTEKITDIVMDSIKGLTLSELSDQAEIGKNKIKKILESPVMNTQLASEVVGNKKYYAPSAEKLPSKKDTKKFEEIIGKTELIPYLENRFKRIDGKKMLHQYTNIGAAINIIKSHEFYLGAPSNMNDVLEYKNFASKNWDDLFFTCFMENEAESIAMWSQYAQPWDDGIRLSISAEKVKEWLNSITVINSANPITKETDGLFRLENSRFIKSIHMVAYTNEDDINDTKEKLTISVGNAKNDKLEKLNGEEKLCGYDKNVAWSYEKEIRFRIQIENEKDNTSSNKIRGIRIAIPDDVIKSIVIMKGPRVQEDSEEWKKLIELLNKEGLNHPTESIFKGKLQNMACDRCKPNQEYRKAHRNSLK